MKRTKVTTSQVMSDDTTNPFWKSLGSNPNYAKYEQEIANIMDQKSAATATAIKGALAEPVQEPDDEVCDGSRGALCIHQDPNECNRERDCPAFAAPPQRKPLPVSEIVTIYDESPTGDSDMIAFARAIERAHRIGVE